MRKYNDGGQLEALLCNGCGKKVIVANGIVREGVFTVNHPWDYFSEKDGELHHWDLCEDCYDRLLADFCIRADVKDQVEFV